MIESPPRLPPPEMRGSSPPPRFPRLEECAHFHYDSCDESLSSLSLSLAPAEEDDGGESDARRFRDAIQCCREIHVTGLPG